MALDSSHKTIASYEKAGFHPIGTTRLDDEEFQLMKPEFRGMVILKKDLSWKDTHSFVILTKTRTFASWIFVITFV